MKPRPIMATVLAGVCALAGCARDSAEAPETGLSTSVSSGAVTLEVRTDADAMRTVDRLHVTIRAEGERGVILERPEFEPGDDGWTVIDATGGVLVVSPGGAVSREIRVTLEPFLAREYQLPGASVAYEAGGEPGVLTTDPLTIEVSTVLAEGEHAELAPARAVLSAPAPESTPAWVAPAIGGGVVVIAAAGLGAWLFGRTRATDPATSAVDRLRALARGRDVAPEEAYDAIAAALHECADAQRLPAVRTLIDECDRVRFGRAMPDATRAPGAIREALALLSPGGAP